MHRPATIVVSLVYVAWVLLPMVGETWLYYVLSSAVEALLLLTIAKVAWTWPRHPADDAALTAPAAAASQT